MERIEINGGQPVGGRKMKKLTNQSKFLVYGTLFIAGLVILTACILLIFTEKGNTKGNIWIAVVLIIISIASVVIMILARRSIKYKAKLLNEEYYNTYEKIADMMQGSALSYLEKRETQNDILGLLIDAQNSGRKVSEVTGSDLTEYVKQVQDSFGYRNKLLFLAISGIQYSIIYLFMIQLYEWVKHGGSFFEAQPGYSSLIVLLPVALVGIPLMRTMIWKQRIILAYIIPLVFVGIGIAFMEITYANFLDVKWINSIHNDVFSYFPGWGFVVLWLGIFIFCFLGKWGLRKHSIAKL